MRLEDIGFYTLSNQRAKSASVSSPMMRGEIILTDKCNFNCPYCRGVREDCKGSLPIEKVFEIIDYWTPIQNIRFSGGEPTLYHHLPLAVWYAKYQRVGNHYKDRAKHIALSTNGSAELDYYKLLIELGVNDFSISLDACCATKGKEMSGGINAWEHVVNNIRELSKLTYVTVGMVFTPENIKESVESVKFAHSLGVADIRVISSAQYNQALVSLLDLDSEILDKHPILKYRIDNFKSGSNVRGIKETDFHKCPLVLDDSAIAGNYHFPCIIYLREQGNPIGEIGPNMREERLAWFESHNTHVDPICKGNCLDVCKFYNTKYRDAHMDLPIPKIDSTLFEWNTWKAGSIHDLITGPCRTLNIVAQRDLIKKHAIGWCKGESLSTRPKKNETALMCFKDGNQFWFHLRNNEVFEIYR
jgi:pyruvate-formate lyase-activating enzyme